MNARATTPTDVLSAVTGRSVNTTDRGPRRIPDACIDRAAEVALLGAVLLDGQQDSRWGVWKRVRGIVRADDFYFPQHGVMWTAFGEILDAGGDLDVVTAAAKLRQMERLNTIGGAQYLGEISDEIATITHAESHAVIVAELSARRTLGVTLGDHARRLASGASTAAATHAAALADLKAVRLPGVALTHIDADVMAWSERMEQRVKGTVREPLWPTSIADLTEALQGGWRPGLNLITARPHIGKTMLMTQEAVYQAKQGHRVFFLSLESSRAQIMDAMVSHLSGIPYEMIVRPRGIDQDSLTAINDAAAVLHNLPITIVDFKTRGCPRTVPQLETVLLALPSEPEFVIIDHIRKMTCVDKHERRQQELGEISQGLHEIGLALGCAINAIVHTKRPERSTTYRLPTMEDMKESGDLEDNTDSCIIMHSEFRYPTEKYAKGSEPPADIVDIMVPKLRNAQCGGLAKIRMVGAVHRFFSTLGRDHYFDSDAVAEATIDDPTSEPWEPPSPARGPRVTVERPRPSRQESRAPQLSAPVTSVDDPADSVYARAGEGLPEDDGDPFVGETRPLDFDRDDPFD